MISEVGEKSSEGQDAGVYSTAFGMVGPRDRSRMVLTVFDRG